MITAARPSIAHGACAHEHPGVGERQRSNRSPVALHFAQLAARCTRTNAGTAAAMFPHMHDPQRLALALALLVPLAGCFADSGEDPGDADLGESADAIHGVVLGPNAGLARVTIGTLSEVWDGVVVEPDLILVSGSFTSVAPGDITVKIGVDPLHPDGTQQRTAVNYVRHPSADVALVKLAAPFLGLAFSRLDFDARAPASLNGVTVACAGYVPSNNVIGFSTAIMNATATRFDLAPSATAFFGLDAFDRAVPCFDTSLFGPHGTFPLVGVSSTAYTSGQWQPFEVAMQPIAPWIELAKTVFDIETTSRRMAYYDVPLQLVRPGFPRVRTCIDLPNGNPTNGTPVNQFHCNYAPNQQWLLDRRDASAPPMIVSLVTGKCLTASSDTGGVVQELPCNGGARQRFSPYSAGGGALRFVSQLGPNLCLTAPGGTADGVQLTVQACGTTIAVTAGQAFYSYAPPL